MTTPQRKAAPVSEGRSSGIVVSQYVAPPSITAGTPKGYSATATWRANLERMAARAAAAPAFCAIADCAVQRLANELKAGGSA